MKSPGFQVIDGKLEILLSAPHVFSHKRPTLTGVYKQGEPWTDIIVRKLAEKTKSYGIYTDSDLEYDPNFGKVEDNPYKTEIGKIVKNGKIKAFIDFHGLSDEHQYDFAIFYPMRFKKSKDLAYAFANGVNKGELRGALVQVLNFKDNNQETLGEYTASRLRIPSIQVEIARYIREDDLLRTALISHIVDLIPTI